MGGSLFKDKHTSRLDKIDYLYLQERITNKLKLLNIEYRTLKFYESKSTFGDLDLLVENVKHNKFLFKSLKDFRILDSFENGNLFSVCIEFNKSDKNDENDKNDDENDVVDYAYKSDGLIEYENEVNDKAGVKRFQIDFIKIDKPHLDISAFYFAYNDLNNLAGKIARQFNCSFGNEGLKYKHYSDNQHSVTYFPLTKDPLAIYNFLGLSYDKFLEGFSTLEDIYDFIKSSKWFYPELYILLNHRDKTRDRKRETYQKFLQYLNVEIKPNIKDGGIKTQPFSIIKEKIQREFNIDIEENIQIIEELKVKRELIKNLTKNIDYSEIPFIERKEMNEFIRDSIIGQLILESTIEEEKEKEEEESKTQGKIQRLFKESLIKWNKITKNNVKPLD